MTAAIAGWCPICLESTPHVLLKREPAVERPIGDPDLDRRFVDIVRCSSCAAVFVERAFDEALLDRFYDREAGSGVPIDMEAFGWWLQNTEAAIQDLLQRIDREERGPLLDVGCGRGTLLYLARQCGWDPTGLDINNAMASFVRNDLKIPTISGTVFSPELPVGHFAVVTLFDVLEHLYEPVRVLQRCAELLRPGGLVVIKSPHGRMQMFKERIRAGIGRGSGNVANIGHINQFDPKSLSKAFEMAGLQPVAVVPAKVFLPAMRGAPFNFRRSVDFAFKSANNAATDVVFRSTGLNLGFNLLGFAKRPL